MCKVLKWRSTLAAAKDPENLKLNIFCTWHFSGGLRIRRLAISVAGQSPFFEKPPTCHTTGGLLKTDPCMHGNGEAKKRHRLWRTTWAGPDSDKCSSAPFPPPPTALLATPEHMCCVATLRRSFLTIQNSKWKICIIYVHMYQVASSGSSGDWCLICDPLGNKKNESFPLR